MPIDRSFIQLNSASTNRIRTLAARLNNQELLKPVGKNWTVAITLSHLAFWDRRVMHALEMTERDGKLFSPEIDLSVNDFSTPLWAAIPPRASRDNRYRNGRELGCALGESFCEFARKNL